MRGVCIVALGIVVALAACGGDDGCPSGDNAWIDKCTDHVAAGTSCEQETEAPALPLSCYCDAGGYWECNSCPFGWVPRTENVTAEPPADGCDPGQTCVLNSWEHGCDCVCGDDRRFHCAATTPETNCPG